MSKNIQFYLDQRFKGIRSVTINGSGVWNNVYSPFNDVRVVGDPGELLQQPNLTTQREKG